MCNLGKTAVLSCCLSCAKCIFSYSLWLQIYVDGNTPLYVSNTLTSAMTLTFTDLYKNAASFGFLTEDFKYIISQEIYSIEMSLHAVPPG